MLLIGTLEHSRRQRPAHTCFSPTGLSACASRPDGVEERYLTVETVRLADLDDLVAAGGAEGRDDGARAPPGGGKALRLRAGAPPER